MQGAQRLLRTVCGGWLWKRLSVPIVIGVLAALVPLAAFADFIRVSGPGVVVISTDPPTEHFAVDLGTVCAGTAASKTVSLALEARSHPEGIFFIFANGSTVALSVASTSGSGLSAAINAPSAITLPANWASLPDGTLSGLLGSTITLNTSTLGAFSGTVVYQASGVQASGASLDKFSAVDVTANVVTCGTPDVKVEKTAAKSSINAGETLAFSIKVSSIGSATATNVVLTDTLPSGLTWTVSGADAVAAGCAGTLAGGSTLTCNFGSLASGATRTVNLSATTTASTCGTITNTATVTATDDSNAGNNSSSASTTVVCQPPASAQFAPTQTTCQDFRDGTAATLASFNYNLKNGAINNVSPGVAFYYVKFTAPASSFTVDITQSDNGSTPAFGAMQLNVYNAACAKIAGTSGTQTISVTGATAGQTYIVSLKVDPSTVVGAANPGTVTYTYVTSVSGTTVPGSSQSILLQD